MAYQKPQAIIHQQFEAIPSITEDELRAVIVGPSAILHRYADADEKINIFVGIVDPDDDQTYSYPGRGVGGVVDESYSKLYVDNALLSYYNSQDNTVDDEGVQRVVTGKEDTPIYAVVTTSEGVTTVDTAITNSPVDAETAVRLFTYKKNENGKLLYAGTTEGTETTNPLDTNTALYSAADKTSFKHLFELATSGDNVPLYVKSDFSGATTSEAAALKINAGDNYPVYIYNKEEGVPADKFYSPYRYSNGIVSNTFNFASGLTPRNGALGARDVAIGDYAMIWTYVKNTGGSCTDAGPQVSRIIGLLEVEAEPTVDVANIKIVQPKQSNGSEATWQEFLNTTTGTDTTLISPIPGTDPINPFKHGILNAEGYLSCTFVITAAQLVTSGNCEGTVWVTIRSDEAGENRTVDLSAGTAAEPILLSTNGYGNTAFYCTTEQIAAIRDYLSADPNATIYWTFSVTSPYRELTKEDFDILKLDDYSGPADTYIFDVTEGAYTLDNQNRVNSSFNVTTTYGRENVRSAELTADAWATNTGTEEEPVYTGDGIALGTQGLFIRFKPKAAVADNPETTADEKAPEFDATTGLPASFRLYIPIVADKIAGYNGILLADDVDPAMRPADASEEKEVSLRLLFNDNIVLPAISPADGRTNWYQESTVFTLNENATTTDPEFVREDGTSMPLTLYGFAGSKVEEQYNQFSKIYFNYREWSPVHANDVTLCESVASLDNIIGPLDPDNPLKYAVYKALTNSNGASVGYVAVKDPTDLDDWQDALSVIEGRDDVYTVVPLTTEANVQNLVITLVNNESGAEACRWKTALFNMELPTEVMRIGFSANNATRPTSTDGKITLCKIDVNPLISSRTVYNKLTCTSGNAKFIDYGVVAGDEVRIINTDGSIKATFTVDQVYSNGTLTITQSLTGPTTEESFEIWHTYTRAEEVNVIRNRAQSIASRRIGLVWPDIVEEGGVELPGYYLSAALAGLKSGVEPQNGLTRRTILGFDGFTRSKPRYTESQLDLMAGSGVWVCVTDSDGTPQSRHALNTDTTNSFYSEEMMTRNFDSVSKYMYQVIDTYIGTSNVTDETLQSIYHNLRAACDYLIGQGQMIDYTKIVVKQHDLLLDRVLAYLDVGLPFAVNNVELFITAEAYELNAVTLESEVE